MAKRRTRKQKEMAKRTQLVSWKPTSQRFEHLSVKRQSSSENLLAVSEPKSIKKAIKSEENELLVLTKKNIFKSLCVFILIVGIEIVLYWF